MDDCPASRLLRPGSVGQFASALLHYPPVYDELFAEIHSRLVSHGAATKADLGALVFWKYVPQAKWMQNLLLQSDRFVRERTAAAFAPGLSDAQRLAELATLPGFGAGGPITSVLLCAWDPFEYGIYDRFARSAKAIVVVPACTCDWNDLPTYFEHLRKIRDELSATNEKWTARMVDIALWEVGKQAG